MYQIDYLSWSAELYFDADEVVMDLGPGEVTSLELWAVILLERELERSYRSEESCKRVSSLVP